MILYIVGGFFLIDEKDVLWYMFMCDGKFVSVFDYWDDGYMIVLMWVFIVLIFWGNGYVGKVVEGVVVDIIECGDCKVDVVCWYVVDWFLVYLEYVGLL